MVAHACNPSTPEVETEGSGIQGQPGLHYQVPRHTGLLTETRKKEKESYIF